MLGLMALFTHRPDRTGGETVDGRDFLAPLHAFHHVQRARPRVIKRFARRVQAKGKDVEKALRRRLKGQDLEKFFRGKLKKKKGTPGKTKTEQSSGSPGPKRPKLPKIKLPKKKR